MTAVDLVIYAMLNKALVIRMICTVKTTLKEGVLINKITFYHITPV